jgi:hypothetical protein
MQKEIKAARALLEKNGYRVTNVEETGSKENRFSLCHIGELIVHLEALYSNDSEFGAEGRRLLKDNGQLDYKKND